MQSQRVVVTDQDEELEPPRPMPYMTPAYNTNNNIEKLTSVEEELKRLEMVFRSYIYDEDKKPIPIIDLKTGKPMPPLMNELGIASVLGQTQAVVRRSSILNHFEVDMIDKLRDYLADCLAYDLMLNRERYGITEYSTRKTIYTETILSATIIMYRGNKGGERGFWGKVTQEIHSSMDMPRKKGILQTLTNPFG